MACVVFFFHAQVDMLYVFDYFRSPQALTHTDSISCIHVGDPSHWLTSVSCLNVCNANNLELENNALVYYQFIVGCR